MSKTISESTDARMRRDVMHELCADPRIQAKDLRVDVQHGVVTLNGIVSSAAARFAAQEAAHRVEGVLDVANDLEVRLPSATSHADTELVHRIREALERNVLVPRERIKMSITHGIVTLEGAVESWVDYDDIERTILNVPGVREVKNAIEVDPPTVTMTALKSSIEDALARHIAHAIKHVEIEIEGSTVTLTGHVPSWAERNAIEGAVRGTRGVRRVQNWIQIQA